MSERVYTAVMDESRRWLAGCSETRKALVQGQMITQWSGVLLAEMRNSLKHGSASEIAGRASNMIGPVAPMVADRWLSDLPASANQAASLILEAILETMVCRRQFGHYLDVGELKQACLGWIESGRVVGALGDCKANQIGGFLAREAASKRGSAQAARLVALAPMAAAVETMAYVADLDDSLIEVLSQTQSQVADRQS